MATTSIPAASMLVLRDAAPADHPWILALAEVLFADLGDYREILGDWLITPRAEAIVASDAGGMLGFAIVAPRPRIGFRRRVGAELVAIAVIERARRNGVGARLVDEARRRASDFGACEMRLHTAQGNTAGQEFFADCGFRPRRALPIFYPSGVRALEFCIALPGS